MQTPPLERWAVDDPDAFFAGAMEGVLDHDVDEFIVSVHRLKTLLAAQALIDEGVGPEVGEQIERAYIS